VIEAEHAEAALGILQIHVAHIHVLFTDLHMPGAMDGLALAHHTAKNWSKIALLLTSACPRPHSRNLPKSKQQANVNDGRNNFMGDKPELGKRR
jgi:response regulator RpfG family c-di-GMP phosphodiesterase